MEDRGYTEPSANTDFRIGCIEVLVGHFDWRACRSRYHRSGRDPGDPASNGKEGGSLGRISVNPKSGLACVRHDLSREEGLSIVNADQTHSITLQSSRKCLFVSSDSSCSFIR
jgi:hypothetical protein